MGLYIFVNSPCGDGHVVSTQVSAIIDVEVEFNCYSILTKEIASYIITASTGL